MLQTTLGVRDISVIQKQDSSFLMCYTDKVGSLYYIRQMTSSNGLSWSSPSNAIQVNNQTGNPALLQRNSGIIYLAYRKDSNIYVSSNSGSGWSSPVQTTASAQGDPALLDIGSDIVVVYKGTTGYFYRISSPNGVTWSSPLQIAPNPALSDPATMMRKDQSYRIVAQYISASALDLVRVLEFSYEGESQLPWSSDVLIRDAQTLQSSMHFEYDSKGRPIERVSRDENGVQTEKMVYTYSGNKVARQDVYTGTSTDISYSIVTGYDNHGNTIYTRDPEGAEHFHSYANTNYQNQFVDSKGVPINLFSNQFYTNNVPSNCHSLPVGEAFINNGKVTEIYYKYDTYGNLTDIKTLFPTRDYKAFSGTFNEPNQTVFEFDLSGLTITDGILVISSIAVPYPETLYETHSEVGVGWQNSGTWQGKYFLADYFRCHDFDCYDGQTKIGPFEHCPGSPNYTEYTTWIEDRTQYVKASYSAIVNEYPEKVDYKLNSGSWITITNDLGSGTTSVTIPASSFGQGVNTLQFQESSTYSTKFEWTLYIDQGATPQEFMTTCTYDSYGNLASMTNSEGHTTTLEYSAVYQHAYLTSRTDLVDGQEITVSITYDFNSGKQISRTCACGSVTDYEYDLSGRLTRIIYPLVLGEQVRADYEIVYDDVNNKVILYNENDEKIVKCYDGLGRMVREELYKDTSVWAQWLYEYNYLDKPKQVTDPLSRSYQYEYDALGRVTKVINPEQSFRTLEYEDVTNTVTIRDENFHKKVYTMSWTGKLLSVREYYGSNYYLTEYTYDQEGNLIKMTDPEHNVTNYVYDSIFGITAVLYPDLTEQHFIYDSVGNLVEKIDQNGNHIMYDYDAVSRLRQVNCGDTSVSFAYDPAGYRTSMVTPDVSASYSYDARNRLTQVSYFIDGKAYTAGYAYDPAGNVIGITYPDNTVVQYTYSLKDQLESIQDFATFTYYPDRSLQQILLSNGVTTDFQYDLRGRVQNIHAYKETDLLDLTYSYDSVGNITQIENDFLTASQEWTTSSEAYSYDDLGRLISASNGFGAISYTYDSKKRSSVTENGQTTPYVYDYDLLLSAGQQTFTHDSNGNTLTKSSESQWEYSYDNANRLTQVNKDSQIFGQYTYDGNNRRVKRTEWSDDLLDYETTIYIYSGMDVIYEENMTGTALYVYGPSGRVAKQTTVNSETNTFYYTEDHLGSTRLVTDENGTPLTSVRYYPFGSTFETLGAHEPYLFSGKEKDETGLYYFGARYYDSETGRFLTRDPYTSLPDDLRVTNGSVENCSKWLMNPQRFSRFNYAGNNPLKFNDPSGLWWECVDPECQALLDGDDDDDQSDDDDPQSEDDDDDEYSTREEECRECDCMERLDIKALLKLKHRVLLGELGIAAAYAILCGIAFGLACAESGPGAGICAVVGAAACGLYFGWITHASNADLINDINWTLKKLKCECAIYCDPFLLS